MTLDFKRKAPRAPAARVAVGGGKASRRATASPELELQKLCEKYLRVCGIRFIRVPDSLWAFVNSRVCPPWLRVFCASYLAGLPDLVILGRERVLYLELKTKSGKLTESQKAFAADYPLKVVRSFEDFKVVLHEWKKAG